MKKLLLLILVILSAMSTYAQVKYNAGVGYHYGGKATQGMIVELEYEKFFASGFSLPLQAKLGSFWGPDYSTYSVELQKGFRKYHDSGLFAEQMFGLGVMATSYKTEMWYIDRYDNVIAHGNKPAINLMPSVSLGLGYYFSSDNFIWLRPKAYWKIGFRGLHLPYLALQAGFSHTFKTK